MSSRRKNFEVEVPVTKGQEGRGSGEERGTGLRDCHYVHEPFKFTLPDGNFWLLGEGLLV